ncbi:glycosyltransferase family 2 protein [Microbacterium protaetiae]|uniref:Glycosyltransferase family 2 protein n=1 Tax=Microbacterium protaetiae TaxID=2509458 RepID=A0A4P6EBK3_9MICO|nr:glycosyltransferase family 2 protein [Microbacterium protaetiae]QAY58683.1 glycosyltransferase family 2 protein [Microbacterium protaetiae]
MEQLGVSVVVPIYNPGPFVRPLLDCLDAQESVTDGFEAIFVDDGSTDATPSLLDHWCAAREWARVIHQPNSGWPSKPRNVGIAAARGEFIFFVDQDDRLADDALARMVGFAREHESDVILGRMVSAGRKVPAALFRRTVPDAWPPEVPLASSMTPHAMFRRSFLDAHGLRFDERARRLEDHLFLSAAYTAARRVSIYADSPVYIHVARTDGGGAGYARYDPHDYYRDLARAIGTIVDAVPAGRARDAFLARWVRRELVGRLRSDAVRWLPPQRRDAFFTAVRETMLSALPEDTVRRLPAVWRWPAALALEATPDEFLRADDRLTTTVRARAQNVSIETLLARDVAADTLARAREHLAPDEPVPLARMAAGRSRALWRRVQLTGLRALGRTGGSLHARLVAWGRTPIVFARQACAVAAPVAAVAASAAAIAGWGAAAPVLVAAAGIMTTFLAVRSTSGWPTACRLGLALVPAAILSAGSAPGIAAVVVTAGLIGAAWAADHRARRTDVRAHAGARAWSRPGWIAAATAVLAAVEVALTAVLA